MGGAVGAVASLVAGIEGGAGGNRGFVVSTLLGALIGGSLGAIQTVALLAVDLFRLWKAGASLPVGWKALLGSLIAVVGTAGMIQLESMIESSITGLPRGEGLLRSLVSVLFAVLSAWLARSLLGRWRNHAAA